MVKKPKILLIVPAYNEKHSILGTCEAISGAKKYDYIVINDGSTDTTEDILREHKIPHIEIVENLGIGGAVQTGYKYALEKDYDIAVQFDGDGQHDIGSVDDLVAPLLDNRADMVIGSRFINKKLDNFRSSALRRVGIKSISNIIKLKTGCRIFDTTSGFRAVGRSLIKYFADNYPVEYPEPISTSSALLSGYKIAEVPAKMNRRSGGKSSISKMKSIYYMISVILCILTLRRNADE